MKKLRDRLIADFSDGEYAHAYMESHAVTHVASQIHLMRKNRGWTQKQLADRAGIAQERVSKIESGDFTSLTMKTLQKFSRAFDVNLEVSFNAFSKGISDIASYSADKLIVRARAQDLAAFAQMTTTITTRPTAVVWSGAVESSAASKASGGASPIYPEHSWMPLGRTVVPEKARIQ